MKTLRFIIWITGVLFMAASCVKSNDYPVTGVDRDMIFEPYHYGDTIRFANEKGEMLSLFKNPRSPYRNTYWEPVGKGYFEEFFRNIFESASGVCRMSIRVQGWCGGKSVKDLYFDLNSCGVKVAYDSKGNLVSRPGNSTLYDSLRIGRRVYYNVAEGKWSEEGSTHYGYYNKSHGVLRLIKDRDTIFTLDTVLRYRP